VHWNVGCSAVKIEWWRSSACLAKHKRNESIEFLRFNIFNRLSYKNRPPEEGYKILQEICGIIFETSRVKILTGVKSSYSFHFNFQLNWFGHVERIFVTGIPKEIRKGVSREKNRLKTEEQMRRRSEEGWRKIAQCQNWCTATRHEWLEKDDTGGQGQQTGQGVIGRRKS